MVDSESLLNVSESRREAGRKKRIFIFLVEDQWAYEYEPRRYKIKATNFKEALRKLGKKEGFKVSEVRELNRDMGAYEVPDRLVIQLVAVV